jgi:hypothetical protein
VLLHQVADRPAPGRGPSAHDQRAPPLVLVECLSLQKGVNRDLRQQIERSALPICAFAEEDKRILSACTAAEKDVPTMPVSSCTNISSRIKRTFFARDFEAKVCSQSRRPRQFERIIFSSPVVDQLRRFLLFIEITDNTLIMQFLYYC